MLQFSSLFVFVNLSAANDPCPADSSVFHSDNENVEQHSGEQILLVPSNVNKIPPRFRIFINCRIVKFLDSGEGAPMISGIPKTLVKFGRFWKVSMILDNGQEESCQADSLIRIYEKTVSQKRLSRYVSEHLI